MGRRPGIGRTVVLLRAMIVWFSYNQLNGPGIHILHAGPRGGILTNWSRRWYNINGILIRTRNTQTFLHFRRFPRYMRSIKG
jgi:hypothetical protein